MTARIQNASFNLSAKAAAGVVAIALVTGCTTLRSWTTDEETQQERYKRKSRNSIVVTKTGASEAVISDKDRNFWVDVRSNAKSTLPRAHAALATGEVIPAQDLARKYLTKHPGHVEAMTVLAAALALDEQYELAAYYADLILNKRAGHPVALNIKGLASMLVPKATMRDFRQAANHFRKAFQSPKRVASGMNLGHLYLELGDADRALSIFDMVIDRCNRCTVGLLGSGIAATRLDKYDKAKQRFHEVLDKDSENSRAHYHLALVYHNGLRKSEEASEHLETILAGSSARGAYISERANTLLRSIKSEKPYDERAARIADENTSESNTQPAAAGAEDMQDAQILMESEAFQEESE